MASSIIVCILESTLFANSGSNSGFVGVRKFPEYATISVAVNVCPPKDKASFVSLYPTESGPIV